MTQFFGVFDIESGELIRAFSTNDISQVAIQSGANNEIVFEGNFMEGAWRIGSDGWPESFEVPVVITVEDVKAHAARILRETDWQISRHREQVEAGGETSLSQEEYVALLQRRQAIRDASGALESMDPIPIDFFDPKYWN